MEEKDLRQLLWELLTKAYLNEPSHDESLGAMIDEYVEKIDAIGTSREAVNG